MENPQELKKAIMAALAEKGDYGTLLQHLDTDEKKEKSEKMYKLIKPISAFADLLTQNNEGAFMEKLTARMDNTTKEALDTLTKEISDLKAELQEATTNLLSSTKSELVSEHLSRYQQAETALSEKMLNLAVEIVANKADEILPSLKDSARLTEDEIEDIIEASALSVESQVSNIIGEYIDEYGINVEQITGFSEAVKKLLPEERQITWGEIVGKPEISQGGTSAVLVKRMIDEALAGFTPGGGGVTDGDKGDITVSGDGTVWTIDNAAVTRNKLEHIQTGHFLGRHASGTGDVQEVSPAQTKTILGVGDANGIAELDAIGKVPASQLPSFVDDVVEAANFGALPATGETGKIYVTLNDNLTYRWSGSAYVEISASLALGETSSTAYRGDRGKIAYDYSQVGHLPLSGGNVTGNVNISGNFGVGTVSPTQKLDIVGTDNDSIQYRTSMRAIGIGSIGGLATLFAGTGTEIVFNVGGEQMRLNGTGLGIGKSNPTVPLDVVGNAAFSGNVTVSDEAYDATSWNGSLQVPTKNAIRDKIESMSAAGGITRSVVVTSGNTTAGSSANTDYVYMVAGAHTITLPTAVSNTNLYTIKNNHSADITVNTTSSQTIDGTTSITLAPFESVQLISNSTNWNIV